MLSLDVGFGQAVQIGDGPDNGAVIKVKQRNGRRVQLLFATRLTPVRLLPDGLIPTRFVSGITGEMRPVRDPAGV